MWHGHYGDPSKFLGLSDAGRGPSMDTIYKAGVSAELSSEGTSVMTIKLSVDLDGCMGYACCMLESPNLFDLDEDSGLAILLVESPSDDQRDEAERAVRACPAGVIALSDE